MTADPDRAVAFLQAGVQRQDMYSMNLLGRNYLGGQGVDKDPKMALTLFQRAIDLGQPYAPASLGRMLKSIGDTSRFCQNGFWASVIPATVLVHKGPKKVRG